MRNSAGARAYSRNKRGVAGALVWINFDRHALLNLFAKARGKFVATKDEIRPQFQDDGVTLLDQTAIFNSQLTRTSGVAIGANIGALDNVAINAVSSFKALAQPWYSDQILPFDVTLPAPMSMVAATDLVSLACRNITALTRARGERDEKN